MSEYNPSEVWNPEGRSKDECWIHLDHTRPDGYSYSNGAYAHRLAWVAFNGPIPNDLQVLHKCDIRNCVNPNHLYLGTQSQNMADKISRLKPGVKLGRTAYMFNKDDISNMKELRSKGVSHVDIANIFKCSRQYVTLLLNGKRGTNIEYR